MVQGIANAAGVSEQDVVITKVTEKARRRQLLAASIEVPASRYHEFSTPFMSSQHRPADSVVR